MRGRELNHISMNTKSLPSTKKIKRIRSVFIGIVIFLLFVSGAGFIAGYFYFGKIIKSRLIEIIKQESKGLYRADIGSLYLNVINGNLTVRDLKLIPDTLFYRGQVNQDALSPLLFRLKIDRFKVENFHILKAILHGNIEMTRIDFTAPEISIYRMKSSKKVKEDKPEQKLLSIPLPKGWNSISIRDIEFKKGTFDFYDFSGDSVTHQSILSYSIIIKNILVDSVHKGKMRLFNAEDIVIKLNGISLRTKNGLNILSFGEICLSTGSNSAWVKNFHLVPQYDRYEYTRKFGFQTDRLDIMIPMLRVERFNLRELILRRKILAGLVEVDGMVLDDYRDKRIPRKPGFKPPMPQDLLRKYTNYLKIDTILLRNGKATYSEQIANEPGRISFDKINTIFTGLTNDSVLLQTGLVSELKGNAYLMGKGKLDATIRFNLGDKKNSFSFSASLGPMDFSEINPMLSKLQPVKVTGGKIRKIEVPFVMANDDIAIGKLLFYYNDLSFDMKQKNESTWNSIKTGVINFVVGKLIVNKDNPNESDKMKTGVIYFKRDKTKGIINLIWKSIFTGIKSTLGFNSKEQKAMKKSDKKR